MIAADASLFLPLNDNESQNVSQSENPDNLVDGNAVRIENDVNESQNLFANQNVAANVSRNVGRRTPWGRRTQTACKYPSGSRPSKAMAPRIARKSAFPGFDIGDMASTSTTPTNIASNPPVNVFSEQEPPISCRQLYYTWSWSSLSENYSDTSDSDTSSGKSNLKRKREADDVELDAKKTKYTNSEPSSASTSTSGITKSFFCLKNLKFERISSNFPSYFPKM